MSYFMFFYIGGMTHLPSFAFVTQLRHSIYRKGQSTSCPIYRKTRNVGKAETTRRNISDAKAVWRIAGFRLRNRESLANFIFKNSHHSLRAELYWNLVKQTKHY